MANFDVGEIWIPLPFRPYIGKIITNTLKIISVCPIIITECKYIYLNGYKNDLHFIDHIEFKKYEPRHEKMCLRESPTRLDTNRPAQPQKLARVLKFQLYNLEILYYLSSEQQRR